jgi:hypothetical protein
VSRPARFERDGEPPTPVVPGGALVLGGALGFLRELDALLKAVAHVNDREAHGDRKMRPGLLGHLAAEQFVEPLHNLDRGVQRHERQHIVTSREDEAHVRPVAELAEHASGERREP